MSPSFLSNFACESDQRLGAALQGSGQCWSTPISTGGFGGVRGLPRSVALHVTVPMAAVLKLSMFRKPPAARVGAPKEGETAPAFVFRMGRGSHPPTTLPARTTLRGGPVSKVFIGRQPCIVSKPRGQALERLSTKVEGRSLLW